MAALAEPRSRTSDTRARRAGKPPALTPEELKRLRARHRRKEIISLIAFCAMLVIVFATRN